MIDSGILDTRKNKEIKHLKMLTDFLQAHQKEDKLCKCHRVASRGLSEKLAGSFSAVKS